MMSEARFKRKLRRIKMRGDRYKREKAVRDLYVEYLPERKKKKVSNIMLAVSVIAIALYTIFNLYITYSTGICVDATLTTCFYAFWGTELLAITGIKLGKVAKGSDQTTNTESAREI